MTDQSFTSYSSLDPRHTSYDFDSNNALSKLRDKHRHLQIKYIDIEKQFLKLKKQKLKIDELYSSMKESFTLKLISYEQYSYDVEIQNQRLRIENQSLKQVISRETMQSSSNLSSTIQNKTYLTKSLTPIMPSQKTSIPCNKNVEKNQQDKENKNLINRIQPYLQNVSQNNPFAKPKANSKINQVKMIQSIDPVPGKQIQYCLNPICSKQRDEYQNLYAFVKQINVCLQEILKKMYKLFETQRSCKMLAKVKTEIVTKIKQNRNNLEYLLRLQPIILLNEIDKIVCQNINYFEQPQNQPINQKLKNSFGKQSFEQESQFSKPFARIQVIETELKGREKLQRINKSSFKTEQQAQQFCQKFYRTLQGLEKKLGMKKQDVLKKQILK